MLKNIIEIEKRKQENKNKERKQNIVWVNSVLWGRVK
jgi:hypothetical protein